MTRPHSKLAVYSAALAGSLGVATMAVDGYAKALDPMHKNETFALVASSTAIDASQEVQNMVTGDVFEVEETKQAQGRHREPSA